MKIYLIMFNNLFYLSGPTLGNSELTESHSDLKFGSFSLKINLKYFDSPPKNQALLSGFRPFDTQHHFTSQPQANRPNKKVSHLHSDDEEGGRDWHKDRETVRESKTGKKVFSGGIYVLGAGLEVPLYGHKELRDQPGQWAPEIPSSFDRWARKLPFFDAWSVWSGQQSSERRGEKGSGEEQE